MQRIARLVDRERHDVEEHVGAAAARVLGRDQAADLAGADRQRAALLEQPLRAHLREAQRIADVVVERALLLQLDDHARLVVVLQVARRPRANRRRRRCRALQQRRRADARELQQLRRLQRAGGDDDLDVGARALRSPLPDAPEAPPSTHSMPRALPRLDDDARHLRAGRDRQVRPRAHRREERRRRVAAPAAAQGELVAAEAVGLRAVEVGRQRIARLGAGGEPRLAARMVVAQVGDAELAARAVPLARAALVAPPSA